MFGAPKAACSSAWESSDKHYATTHYLCDGVPC